MIINEALMYPSYEIIGGEKIMAPSASSYHNAVMGGFYVDIVNYLRKNNCGYVFTDNVDVNLPDGSRFKPDLIVVKSENANIINWNGAIHGVPDMVVEVLSKSTRKKDLTVKKILMKKTALKNTGLSIRTWKLLTCIFCATENMNLTANMQITTTMNLRC